MSSGTGSNIPWFRSCAALLQRERPDQSNHQSFPSGHSVSAFATAGVLQRHYGWKAGIPATVIAATARPRENCG